MHSFQNMYGMLYAKVDRLAGKIDFVQKQPLKRPFWGEKNELFWVWEELEAKPFTTGQLLGHPWKLMDITLQMSYVEGRWPQNWDRSKPTDYFTRVTQNLVKIFLQNSLSKDVPISNIKCLSFWKYIEAKTKTFDDMSGMKCSIQFPPSSLHPTLSIENYEMIISENNVVLKDHIATIHISIW